MRSSPGTSYRVVIVGTGGISRAHARVCQQNDQTDLVAVCDVSQANTHIHNVSKTSTGFIENSLKVFQRLPRLLSYII